MSALVRSRYTFVNRPICQHLSIDYVSLSGPGNAAKPALWPVSNFRNPSHRRKQPAGLEEHPGEPADLPISQRDSEKPPWRNLDQLLGHLVYPWSFLAIRIRCVTPAELGKLCDAAGR